MTKEQDSQQMSERVELQEFEKQNGLEEAFGLWRDEKTGQDLMFSGTFIQEVELEGKVATQIVIGVRYISGRARMFTEKIWNMKTKKDGEKVKRFRKL